MFAHQFQNKNQRENEKEKSVYYHNKSISFTRVRTQYKKN